MLLHKKGFLAAIATAVSLALLTVSPMTVAGDDAKKAECKKEAKAKKFKDKNEKKAFMKECMKADSKGK